VVAVATAEEMPVNETIGLSRALQEDGLELDLVIVNGLYPPRFGPEDVEELTAALGRTRSRRSRSALRAALSEHARAEVQREQHARLAAELGGRLADLPYVFAEQVGPEQMGQLADVLAEQLTSQARATS
jgi:anion-transporting  ArsA/GET3 family ATPase